MQVGTVYISPGDGSEIQPTDTITITCDTSDVYIYYTLDGSTPTQLSTLYTVPFIIGDNTTQVSARAFAVPQEVTHYMRLENDEAIANFDIVSDTTNSMELSDISLYSDIPLVGTLTTTLIDETNFYELRGAKTDPNTNIQHIFYVDNENTLYHAYGNGDSFNIEEVTSSSLYTQSNVSIAFDSSGDIHLAVAAFSEDDINYLTTRGYLGWGGVQRVGHCTPADSSYDIIDIVVDSNDDIHIIYTYGTSGIFRSSKISGIWSKFQVVYATNDIESTDIVSSPKISIDSDNDIHIYFRWYDNLGSETWHLYYMVLYSNFYITIPIDTSFKSGTSLATDFNDKSFFSTNEGVTSERLILGVLDSTSSLSYGTSGSAGVTTPPIDSTSNWTIYSILLPPIIDSFGLFLTISFNKMVIIDDIIYLLSVFESIEASPNTSYSILSSIQQSKLGINTWNSYILTDGDEIIINEYNDIWAVNNTLYITGYQNNTITGDRSLFTSEYDSERIIYGSPGPGAATIYDIPVIKKSYYDGINQRVFESQILQQIVSNISLEDYKILTDFSNIKFTNTDGKCINMGYNTTNRVSIINLIDTLPSISNDGDRYILTSGDYTNYIAQCTDSTANTWIYKEPTTNDIVTITALSTKYIYSYNGWLEIPEYQIPLELDIEIFKENSYIGSNTELATFIRESVLTSFQSRFGSNISLYRSEIIDVVQSLTGVDHCRLLQPVTDIFFNFDLTNLTKAELLTYGPDYIYFGSDNITVRIL